MKKIELPKPDYYKPEQLAKKWQCDIEDVWHYAVTGQMPISVVAGGWLLEYREAFEDDCGEIFHSTVDCKRLWGSMLTLTTHHSRLFAERREFENPDFIWEAGGENAYIRIGGDCKEPIGFERVTLREGDAFFTKGHVEVFENKGEISSENNSAIRGSNLHKERSRAIAQMLWAQDASIPIAQMAERQEIITYGCESKIYAEKTMRLWLKDLHPNPTAGRPKKLPPN